MTQTVRMRLVSMVAAVGLLAGACAPGDEGQPTDETAADAGQVTMFSTQLNTVEESEAFRSTIVADFEGQVEFVGSEYGPWADRVTSEVEAGEGTIDLLGGLHGDYVALGTDALSDLSDLMGELGDRGFSEDYTELAKLGTDTTYYVPWMQATYIMVANQQAMELLPEGASVDSLTYEQLTAWAQAIAEAEGRGRLGFPAGPNGLMHRFFQGYLIPSFTGGLVTTFTESEPAWTWLADTWQYVHPQSTNFEFMQEPLLSGEVWLAWDHVARLKEALEQSPEEFTAFPAPAGPAGLAFMPVLAGLAVPSTAPNPEGARALIEYLTQPEVQGTALQQVGFFPVVKGEFGGELSEGLQEMSDAVSAQADAENALPSLLPIGLGEESGTFNKVFIDTFQQAVLEGGEIAPVLEQQAGNLSGIMEQTGAPCWQPDPPSDGEPCPVG